MKDCKVRGPLPFHVRREVITGGRNLCMEKLSWDAYKRGDFVTLQEAIDELRVEIAGCTHFIKRGLDHECHTSSF